MELIKTSGGAELPPADLPHHEEKFTPVWDRVKKEVEYLIEKEATLVDKEAALELLNSPDFEAEATKTWGDPHLARTDDEKRLALGVFARLKDRLDN